jgi:60S ribosomal protein uL30
MAAKRDRKQANTERLLRKKQKEEKLKERLKLSVPVPEGLKKAWERENRVRSIRKMRREAKLKALPQKRKEQAERIKKYEAEYQQLETERLTNIKNARLTGNFFKPEDAKIAVVVRIRGINRVSPKVRKVLQLFRLLQLHNAVFIKLNKATINMLKLIQPYVAYGYPSVECIRSLIYKRGFAKIRHRPGAISRIPIMSSDIIEQHLGRYGIQTVEDMVHEIATAGPNFSKTSNFLWPFKLNCPRGGYRGRKRRHFLEGGTYGNWQSHINHLVVKML